MLNNTSFGKTEDFDVSEIIEINDFIYGLTFSAGYNKWNLHLYYGLNNLFNETGVNNYDIGIDINAGTYLYINNAGVIMEVSINGAGDNTIIINQSP